MIHVTRKPVFGGFRPAGCTATVDSKRLEILFLGIRGIVLFM